MDSPTQTLPGSLPPPPAAGSPDPTPMVPQGTPPAAAVVVGGTLNEGDAGELARTRAERDELRARLSTLESKPAAAPVQDQDDGDWFSKL